MNNKIQILLWMNANHKTHYKFVSKDELCKGIFEDLKILISMRELQQCLSDLRHEGHLASLMGVKIGDTLVNGWWAVPQSTNDPLEIEAIIASLKTKERKLKNDQIVVSNTIKKYSEHLETVKN